MCKSASDPTCECACIDGCTPQCIKDYSNYCANNPDPNLIIIGETSEEERKLTTEDPEISGRISKEYCQEAKDGFIEALKNENKFLTEQNQNLSGELRSAEMKAAELEKKLNTRKKLWGFSWENVINLPLVAAVIFCTIGSVVSYCSSGYVAASAIFFYCGLFGIICTTGYLFKSVSLNTSKIVSGVLGIILSVLMMIGVFENMVTEREAGAISKKVSVITNEIQSPAAILKREKEKLDQEVKEMKDELNKKKIEYY